MDKEQASQVAREPLGELFHLPGLCLCYLKWKGIIQGDFTYLFML